MQETYYRSWSIFVLGSIRLCLNTDYDYLHHVANYDILVRQILGVQDGMFRGRDFELQNIKDNVRLLDDACTLRSTRDTLREINTVIVQAGHGLVKKKGTEPLRIKVDSFVTEANVHFPTDYFILRTKYKYNLLWDSGRKCIDVLVLLMLALCAAHVDTNSAYCTGWRKIKNWCKNLKNSMLSLCNATADKSKNRSVRLRKAAEDYLSVARKLYDKVCNVKQLNDLSSEEEALFKQLKYFREMLGKHIDLVDRRLLKGETIPHEEKIFSTSYFVQSTSIFEPWVEWICKGKKHKPVELGTLTCVATDQWHFVVDWWAADHQRDNQLLLPVIDRIRQNYSSVASCSSDRGFFSKIDVDVIELFDIKAFIPKKGKRNLADIQRENDPDFIKARHAHSAIESNINELEHNGLDRCPDKGIKGMRRYIGLAVIAYNLRRIGKILQRKDKEEAIGRKSTKLRRAA